MLRKRVAFFFHQPNQNQPKKQRNENRLQNYNNNKDYLVTVQRIGWWIAWWPSPKPWPCIEAEEHWESVLRSCTSKKYEKLREWERYGVVEYVVHTGHMLCVICTDTLWLLFFFWMCPSVTLCTCREYTHKPPSYAIKEENFQVSMGFFCCCCYCLHWFCLIIFGFSLNLSHMQLIPCIFLRNKVASY